MWVTQSYLATVEPEARVFIYYLFEEYNEQKGFTEDVQRHLERIGETHGGDVSLLMPNPRYADRIEAEVRQIVPLWELVYGTLPALLITTKPMKELDANTEQCIYIPFNNQSAEEVARVISEARRITYETLCWAHKSRKNPQQDTFKKRIGESIELKPGMFGFRIDLKKLFRK